MKSQLYYTALLLLSFFITASSCNKDNMDDKDKDWNVLEWTVDGERYKAECEGGPLFGCDPVDCQYYNDSKTLEFVGSGENGAIKVYKYKNLIITGQNNDFNEYDKLNFRSRYSTDSCIIHSLNKNLSHQFYIINVDTIYKFIEGKFSFTGINKCQDTIQIEDGYFKLSYRP